MKYMNSSIIVLLVASSLVGTYLCIYVCTRLNMHLPTIFA